MKKNPLKSNAVQSLIASLVCILLGLFIGYLALLIINPAGAGKAILDIVKNFLTYNKPASQLKYFGNTLVKTAPLLMCALSVLFAYKVGLFNIGAAGQYVAGSCACLYAALAWGWGWLPCMLLAIVCRRGVRLRRGPAEILLQRQRGHLRHHAQLDRPLHHEHDPDERQGGHQPLYPPDEELRQAGHPALAGL